jgi:DNA-binding NarL/FixJ family response regulator
MSIVLVDDQRFVRELICGMLSRNKHRYNILAEGSDARTALALCKQLKPDLLILDINLPDQSGVDAVPALKRASPRTRILLCTAYASDDRVLDALRSGAHGFVEKTNTWDEFIHAIDCVGGGEHFFYSRNSGALSDVLSAGRTELAPASTVALSAREKEVLKLIAHGSTNKEIAQKLGISVGTVDSHRVNLMTKLRIRNVAGLVVFAFRSGLIRITPTVRDRPPDAAGL